MVKVSLIYAQNEDGAIGLKGSHPMPWHFPEDMQRFAALTKGKAMVMGSSTFDSLPRILPGRFHYVMTRSQGLPRLGRLDQVQFLNSLEQVFEKATLHAEELFVIGGGDILNQAMHWADTIYRTVVLNTPLRGRELAKVKKPGEDPIWKRFKLTDTQRIDDRLIFETYERII
ncbi:putative dihydrofolate reductase [Pseudomonas phage pPa_SNUABM_DT01]|nr:putative dihydrofolate reductase [Pseudomonas phage pPa_SNUABM_DT01]